MEHTIDIILTDLSASVFDEELFCKVLDEEEKRRCKAYLRCEDKKRFVYARALLRLEISKRTGLHPTQVEIRLDKYNKPFWVPVNIKHNIDFNLSHSGRFVLMGVSENGFHIGVDVEKFQTLGDHTNLAPIILSNEENARLQTGLMDPQNRLIEIFSAKEAVLKLFGQGLSVDPRTVSIPDQLLETSGQWFKVNSNVACYCLKLPISPGYCGFVAVYKVPSNLHITYKSGSEIHSAISAL